MRREILRVQSDQDQGIYSGAMVLLCIMSISAVCSGELSKNKGASLVLGKFTADFLPGMEELRWGLGGHYLLAVRNSGETALQIRNIELNGVSVPEHLKRENGFSSIWFGDNVSNPSDPVEKLVGAGEPVWHKIMPATIPAGKLGFVLIKARSVPQKAVEVRLTDNRGGVHTVPVVPEQSSVRLAYVGFGPDCDRMVIFVRKLQPEKLTIDKVYLDETDITSRCEIKSSDFWKDLGVITASLARPLKEGSYHLLRITTKQGPQAVDIVRAKKDFFPIGIYGWSSKGATAIERMYDFYRSLNANYFNTNLTFIWPKDKALRNSPRGRQLAESNGIMLINSYHDRRTSGRYWYLYDEVDIHDGVNCKSLPESKRLGCSTQVEIVDFMKQKMQDDPSALGWLQMDGWGMPTHYFIYSRAVDIPSGGDYAGQGKKQPIEVYNALTALRWAAMPGPFNTLIYAAWEKSLGVPRFPTPGEEKIMAYYCLASGGKGLCYYTYDDSAPGGTGDHGVEGNPALLKAIGDINHTVQTIAPMLLSAYPVEDLVVNSEEKLWARTLLCADGKVILILVNHDFVSEAKGFTAKPLKDVSVTVQSSPWLELKEAAQVDAAGVQKVHIGPADIAGEVNLRLQRIETAELVVIGESGIAGELDRRFNELHNVAERRVARLTYQLIQVRKELDRKRADMRAKGILIESGCELDDGRDLADWRLNIQNGAWPRYIDVDTIEKRSGRYSLRVNAARHYSLPVVAVPGETYQLEFYVKFSRSVSDDSVIAGIEYLGHSGLVLDATEVEAKPVSTDWHQVTCRSTVPPGAATVRMYFEKHGDASKAWVDDVRLVNLSR